MGRKPQGEIMSETEMIAFGNEKRSTRVYKAESLEATDKAVKNLVTRGLAEIVNADRRKIDFNDTELVREVSKQYIKACADTSTIPSIAGLARAMGVDRTTLYLWMKKRDTETGRWLTMCRDLFSDLLSDGALKNAVNPIVAIFLQKAQFGLHDTVVTEANPYEDAEYDTGSDYKKRYMNLIRED